DIIPYLEGKKFSNGLNIKISEKENSILNRIDFLAKVSENKTIVHIGFADHLPLIAGKIKNNTWLHKRLLDVSAECIGIDNDKKVVEYVQTELKIKDVYCLDIIKDPLPAEIQNKRIDFLILGEVLEHIDNPVSFLSSLREKFTGITNQIIVTVPNAWELSNLKLLRSGYENLNSDHRYWFTPYTLAKVGFHSGLSVKEFFYVQSYNPRSGIVKMILKRWPAIRENVLMIFDF
ncbi:MAG: methyltransferase domain-containing protein, partial [Flavitalea sp.]